jgi:hypothetical protein
MKKYIIFLLTFINHYGYSQKNNDFVEAMNQLRQTQLYQECQKFKDTVEAKTDELKKLNSDEAKLIELENGYSKVWQKYDYFLKTIKDDIISGEKLENITSDNRALQYLALLSDVKKEYNMSLLPLYQLGKDIPDEVLQIGINLIKQIILKIKTRKAEKKEEINAILPKINEYFYDNVKLKTWSELDSRTQNPENFSTKKQKITIPAATLTGNFEGNIEFIQLDNSNEVSMEFQKNEGKNIIIDEKSDATYRTPYFVSNNSYANGTRYKLKATASVFVYVVALNSEKVEFLHPSINYKQSGKNIEVEKEETPTIGQFLMPQKGAFKIVDSNDGNTSDSEDFGLIVTNVELNIDDTIEKLNNTSGKLDERFSIVFAEQQITHQEAQVQMQGGQINFSYQNGEKKILPLVFKILR